MSYGGENERQPTNTEGIKIGMSMDSLRVERWRKDRDIFIKRAEVLGAEVIVQHADGDARRQNEQAENMITQGVDVLVVIPKDGVAGGADCRNRSQRRGQGLGL